jgi:hypothetical protein
MFIKSNLLKISGITASLVSALAIAAPSFALNPTIGNNLSENSFGGTNIGQSFINDPTSTGTIINLNSWTFGLAAESVGVAANSTLTNLSIFLGTGNGGRLIGSSTTTSLAPVSGIVNPATPITWTFAGGLQLRDNVTYTAVIVGNTPISFRGSVTNPYPNGGEFDARFTGSAGASSVLDTVFRGNFSAIDTTPIPIPFEFSPVVGLSVLGGIASFKVGSRLIKKAKAAKNA